MIFFLFKFVSDRQGWKLRVKWTMEGNQETLEEDYIECLIETD